MARILIVDDDNAVRTTIKLLLERAGHSVVAASDGRSGLAQFETDEFDLLFLDIFMPGMDGIETMRLGPSTAAAGPDHRHLGQSHSVGFRPDAGFPDNGDQARGGLQPAEAVQTRRPDRFRQQVPGNRQALVGISHSAWRCLPSLMPTMLPDSAILVSWRRGDDAKHG